VAVVKLVDEPIGRLPVERHRAQQPRQRAMRGDPRVLGIAAEGHDHVALDVGERALALAVGIPGEGAGPLPPAARATREAPDRRLGSDRSGEGADALGADVVQRRSAQQPQAARRGARREQARDGLARLIGVGVALAQRGHRFFSHLGCRFTIS
jgi:hypothetical protein